MAGRSDADADLVAQTQAPVLYPIFLGEIGYGEGAERAWTGIGPLVWDGKTFEGAAGLVSVSAVVESSGLEANALTFTLSGVPVEKIQQAIADFRYGLPAKLWLGVLDADGIMIGEPYQLANKITDSIKIDDSGDTCSISITAESPAVTMDAALNWRYTDADQKRRHPGDRGFEYVASLQDKTVTFGKS